MLSRAKNGKMAQHITVNALKAKLSSTDKCFLYTASLKAN